VPWVTFTSAAAGSGNGSVPVNIAANAGAARTTTVTVADQTVTIEQAAAPVCTYALKPTYYDAGRGPDSVSINVTAGAGCIWTARSDVAWVSVDSGKSGSGNGTVVLRVQGNSGAPRSTVLTIAGQPFTLRQEGSCTATLKPTNYHAGRGPDDITIRVTVADGCTWTATSSVSWVTVAEGATGTGDGSVRLLVSANEGEPRSVTLTIAGQPFELKQDGRK
jgi:hypothetical protein